MCGETKISAKYNLPCDNKCFCEKIVDHLIDNDKNGWITIPDYYNNVYVKEVA